MNEDANQEAPVDIELVKLLLRQYGLNGDEWPDDVEGYPLESVERAKVFVRETQQHSIFHRTMTQEQADTEDEELEAAVDEMRTTIDIPTPTEDADIVAEWIRSPDRMLTDLTAALNSVLEDCRWIWAGELWLQYRGDIVCRQVSYIHFVSLKNHVTLRNAIEQTPFQEATVDRVCRLLQNPDGESVETTVETQNGWSTTWGRQEVKPTELRDVFWQYEAELRCLANWNAVRQQISLQGKRAPTPAPKTATESDCIQAFEELRANGKTSPTNRDVRAALQSKGKTLSNGKLNSYLGRHRNRVNSHSGQGR
jgi:hypothetical protein